MEILYFQVLTPIMATPEEDAMAKKSKLSPGTIAQNKRARFEYELHEKFETGIVLTGWEVKAVREGKCQLTDT